MDDFPKGIHLSHVRLNGFGSHTVQRVFIFGVRAASFGEFERILETDPSDLPRRTQASPTDLRRRCVIHGLVREIRRSLAVTFCAGFLRFPVPRLNPLSPSVVLPASCTGFARSPVTDFTGFSSQLRMVHRGESRSFRTASDHRRPVSAAANLNGLWRRIRTVSRCRFGRSLEVSSYGLLW